MKPTRGVELGRFFITFACLLLLTLCCVGATLADKVTRVDPSDPNADLDQFTTPAAAETALVRMHTTKKRDLGLIALKAILLGPLIGLTFKAALVRGLVWALLAYGLHLFFPALLGTLGLGTGLVGFARQIRPDYNQMFLTYFLNLIQTLPISVSGLTGQYHQMIAPLVDSIRAIPEGHCRYRAVCETASHLVKNARSMSSSLQRISATVFTNFGNDYSKAWLDGVVQSDCAAKYTQCVTSPFSMVVARLAQSLGQGAGGTSGGGINVGQLASFALNNANFASGAAGIPSTTTGPLSATGQVAAAIAQTMAPNSL